MNTIISFTPAQLFASILGVCAGISCIAGAVGWLIKGIRAAKKPSQRVNDRLTALEEGHKQHMEYLEQDKRRLDVMEQGNRISQRALLALLKHGIDGNDVDGMRKAEIELQEFLIER